MPQRRAAFAAAAVVCVCSLQYVRANVYAPIAGLGAPSDFLHYYRAGQAILSGKSPFADPEYLYPPLIAFVAAPLALTDYVTARWIWFLFSQVCFLAAAWVMWRALGRDWIAASCVAAVWGFGGAAVENFALGQAGPLLVLLLAIAYTSSERLQGAVAGVGFAVKYLPGALAAAIALSRDRRAAAAFAVAGIALFLIPWLAIAAAFQGAKAPASGDYWMGTPATLSWSVPSALLRALDAPKAGGPLPYNWAYGNSGANLHLRRWQRLLSLAAAATVFAGGVLVLVVKCRGRLSQDQLPWAMAGLVSLSLAASPVCWTHYQVLQYPGIAMLLASSLGRRNWGLFAWVVVWSAMLYQVPVAVLSAYYHQHGGWTAASPATLYIWTSVTPFACLALFGLCLSAARIGKTASGNQHTETA